MEKGSGESYCSLGGRGGESKTVGHFDETLFDF